MTSFDEYGESYYQANGQSQDRPALRWYASLARRYLGSGPILDVGCGTGYLMKRLAAQGSQVDGVEVSPYSAATARITSPSSTVYADAQLLPAETYARFTAIHVVEHLADSDLRKMLEGLRRAALPQARYLIVTPDLAGRARQLHGDRWNAFRDPTHINLKGHREWREFFVGEGFEVIREASDGMWNVPYSNLPKPVDALRRSAPMALQFLSGRLFLRPGSGESSLFVLH